jgi:hypothetical protein
MITCSLNVIFTVDSRLLQDKIRDAGSGVHVYVLDTGIKLTHKIFGDHAVNFKDFTDSPYCNAPMVCFSKEC